MARSESRMRLSFNREPFLAPFRNWTFSNGFFASFRAALIRRLSGTFAPMSLSQSLLKQLWDAGYGGKVIRVPAKNREAATQGDRQ